MIIKDVIWEIPTQFEITKHKPFTSGKFPGVFFCLLDF